MKTRQRALIHVMSHGLVFTAVAESGIVHSCLSDHTRLLFLSTLPCSSSFDVLLRQKIGDFLNYLRDRLLEPVMLFICLVLPLCAKS